MVKIRLGRGAPFYHFEQVWDKTRRSPRVFVRNANASGDSVRAADNALDNNEANSRGHDHNDRNDQGPLLAAVEQRLHDETTAFHQVHVVIEQGVLHLKGSVISNELRRHASELANMVPGVTSVANDLAVIPSRGSNLAGTAHAVAEEWRLPPQQNGLDSSVAAVESGFMTDTADEVANAVSYALATDTRTGTAPIVVQHNDGVIYLRGQVNSIAVQQMAEALAASQPGVTAVVNGLTVGESAEALLH